MECFSLFFERFLGPDIFGKKTALSVEKLNCNQNSNSAALCTCGQKTEIPCGARCYSWERGDRGGRVGASGTLRTRLPAPGPGKGPFAQSPPNPARPPQRTPGHLGPRHPAASASRRGLGRAEVLLRTGVRWHWNVKPERLRDLTTKTSLKPGVRLPARQGIDHDLPRRCWVPACPTEGLATVRSRGNAGLLRNLRWAALLQLPRRLCPKRGKRTFERRQPSISPPHEEPHSGRQHVFRKQNWEGLAFSRSNVSWTPNAPAISLLEPCSLDAWTWIIFHTYKQTSLFIYNTDQLRSKQQTTLFCRYVGALVGCAQRAQGLTIKYMCACIFKNAFERRKEYT